MTTVRAIKSTAKIFTKLRPNLSGLNKGIIIGGPSWIRTNEGVSQQIYSLPQLTALVSTLFSYNPCLIIKKISTLVKPNK